MQILERGGLKGASSLADHEDEYDDYEDEDEDEESYYFSSAAGQSGLIPVLKSSDMKSKATQLVTKVFTIPLIC